MLVASSLNHFWFWFLECCRHGSDEYSIK